MDFLKVVFALVYSVIITIYTVALISAIFGYVFMMAWNLSMPILFELPVLTYWQGMAIIFMSRILTNNIITIKTESKK